MPTIKRLAVSLALSVLAMPVGAAPIKTPADANGPAQTEIPPPSGKGRVVIVVSGALGPDYNEDYAERVAKLGYDTILLKGDDILSPDKQGGARLQQAIARAQGSSNALPGKVAVIGISKGGGGALTYATKLPDAVSVVVVYYPGTAFLLKLHANLKSFAGTFKVPVLALQGAKDTYKKCCLLSTIQTIASGAKELGLPFDLVVYPNANHGFIKGANYRAADADDAWKRTTEALKQHLSE